MLYVVFLLKVSMSISGDRKDDEMWMGVWRTRLPTQSHWEAMYNQA